MPTFHLVVDEVVPVDKFQFRVRIWRGAGFPPLVLSCQVPGHPPPDWYSAHLANFTLGSFLGYRLPIPVFFEFGVWDQKTRAFRVRYETIGCDLRPVLQDPSYTTLKPSAVEQRFGATLGTLLKESPTTLDSLPSRDSANWRVWMSRGPGSAMWGWPRLRVCPT